MCNNVSSTLKVTRLHKALVRKNTNMLMAFDEIYMPSAEDIVRALLLTHFEEFVQDDQTLPVVANQTVRSDWEDEKNLISKYSRKRVSIKTPLFIYR